MVLEEIMRGSNSDLSKISKFNFDFDEMTQKESTHMLLSIILTKQNESVYC